MELRKNIGITLVALIVTVVVLLILSGVVVIIVDELVIDKAILAYNETTEKSIQEQIEIAWSSCQMAYWNDVIDNPTLDKKQYFKDNLEKSLSNIDGIEEIKITEDNQQSTNISYKYKNQIYNFTVDNNGKTKLTHLLKGNVKVGDYINYPVEYDDVYSKNHYTSENGWRVIDDGFMEGTSGSVKIVSAGIPAKWFYDLLVYENAGEAVEKLNNDFENINFADESGKENIDGSYFKIDSIANKISVLSLTELNNAYNALYQTTRESNDVSQLSEDDYLFNLHNKEIFYWLSTVNENKIYSINQNNIRLYSDIRVGIRPVIYLNENLSGKQELQIWNIDN